MTIDPHIQAMLEATKPPEGLPPLDMLPAEMVRAGYKSQRTSQDTSAPKDVVARELRVAGAAGEIPARLYTPPGAAATTAGLVYFHGGGFVIGDLDTHDGLCRRLAARAGIRVLSVDYRLAPENPFPASHDDALAATRWAFDHAAEIGFDPGRIAVGGDSAGGNLSAVISHEMLGDPDRKLAFQLLLYPALAMSADTPSRRDLDGPLLTKEAMAWFEKCLAAHAHPDGHRMAYGDHWTLEGLPPALVVTAGFDPLKDEGRDYERALRNAGVQARHIEFPTLVHDFYLLADVSPAVVEAINQTADVLKAALA
jgi:acetyl esterase